MTSRLLLILTVVAAVGSGVVGGALFAFSSFVMKALDQLSPSDSISAMQAINRQAPSPLFAGALTGTALVCIVVAVSAIVRWGEPGSAYLLAGSVLYLLTVLITAAFHIPRNDALDLVDANAAGAAATWADHYRPWMLGNHVRTLTAVAGAALLTLGSRVLPG